MNKRNKERSSNISASEKQTSRIDHDETKGRLGMSFVEVIHQARTRQVFESNRAAYPFTEAEEDVIRQALELYHPSLLGTNVSEEIREELITFFIFQLEHICSFFKKCFGELPTRAARPQELQEFSKNMKATLRHLRSTLLPRLRDDEDMFSHHALIKSLRAKKLQRLEAPIEEISKILEELQAVEEKKPVPVPKPSAELGTALVRKLARTYEDNLFAKPALHIDGPFILLVRTVLEILGLKSEDPSRIAKDMLKRLR